MSFIFSSASFACKAPLALAWTTSRALVRGSLTDPKARPSQRRTPEKILSVALFSAGTEAHVAKARLDLRDTRVSAS
jgi:hypothetical protein